MKLVSIALVLYICGGIYLTQNVIENDFAIILLKYEKNVFSIIPLCTKDKLLYVIDFVLNYIKNEYKRIQLKGINQEMADIIKINYKEKFI